VFAESSKKLEMHIKQLSLFKRILAQFGEESNALMQKPPSLSFMLLFWKILERKKDQLISVH
jgi:hypothetical protein